MSIAQNFQVVVVADSKGRVLVPVPFDPNTVWGTKGRHPERIAKVVDLLKAKQKQRPSS